MEAFKYSLLGSLSHEIKEIISEHSIFSVTDELGRIEYVNNDYCEILERDANVLIGETHELLKSHLHANKVYADLWRTIKAGEKWNGILSDSSHTGKQFWLDATIIPIKNKLDKTISYVGVYNDVTKYQLQNIQLQERNSIHLKYKSIYESINAGIIVVADNEGNIIEWNKGAEIAFGYSKVEIIGYPLTILINKKIRNIKQLLRTINKTQNSENVNTIEMVCMRKNGEEFPVEFTLNTLNVNGTVFYSAVVLDITRRKKAEEELKEKTKNLELFLYRISHDLKAPFSTAEGLLDLLKNEEKSERIESLIGMLETTIKGGDKLIKSLSEASINSCSKDEFEQIDFNNIIKNVLKMFSGSKNFELFEVNIDVDKCQNYNSNPELLCSIFQNLIHNAIKYSKEPTKKHVPCINISVKELRGELFISVSDNGQGISESDVEKIFDLYYRSAHENIPGNGLGLYIVKNIIENLKGKISVKSVINKGTRFRIKLPILK